MIMIFISARKPALALAFAGLAAEAVACEL